MGTKADRYGFYLRGRVWYTNDPLTRKDISTRCRDLAAAKRWRATRERLAADPAAAAAEAATLGDECRLMLDALGAVKRPTEYYEAKLGHWPRILGNDCPLAEAGAPAAFDAFIAARRAEGVTDHTISKEIKCAITMLKYAKRAGRFAGALETLRPLGFTAGYVPRTRALSLTELAAVLPELEDQVQAFVALAVALGLRRGEIHALRPGDIDQVAWVVHVRGTKTTGARRDLPVLEPFRDLVAAAARQLPITWGKHGRYTDELAVACSEAGIPRFTPNDLRRTHATLLRSAGVGADVARALLGHTKGSQLLELVYDKPKPQELAARAGALPELTAAASNLARALQSDDDPAAIPAPGMAMRGVLYPSLPPTQEDPGTSAPEVGRPSAEPDAESLHPAAAWALALAAESLQARRRRVFVVNGVVRRRGKARDAG